MEKTAKVPECIRNSIVNVKSSLQIVLLVLRPSSLDSDWNLFGGIHVLCLHLVLQNAHRLGAFRNTCPIHARRGTVQAAAVGNDLAKTVQVFQREEKYGVLDKQTTKGVLTNFQMRRVNEQIWKDRHLPLLAVVRSTSLPLPLC